MGLPREEQEREREGARNMLIDCGKAAHAEFGLEWRCRRAGMAGGVQQGRCSTGSPSAERATAIIVSLFDQSVSSGFLSLNCRY